MALQYLGCYFSFISMQVFNIKEDVFMWKLHKLEK